MAMNRTEIAALGLAAAVMLATPLAVLATAPELSAEGVAPPLAVPPAPPALAAAYARPLFGGGEGATSESPLPADAPDLIGVVGRIGSDAVAMVRAGDGSTRTLSIGEGVDGWTLESLAIDAAFFTRGGQRLRVPLPAG